MREAGTVLVVDEAFADFIPEISVAAMVEQGLWVARSLTKFFAIPGLAARLPSLRRRGARPEAPTFVAGQRRRRCRRHRSRQGRRLRRSWPVAEVARLRGDLFRALDDLDGLQPFPAGRTSFSSVGRRGSPRGLRAGACSSGAAGRLWGDPSSSGRGPKRGRERAPDLGPKGGTVARTCPHPRRRPKWKERPGRASGPRPRRRPCSLRGYGYRR